MVSHMKKEKKKAKKAAKSQAVALAAPVPKQPAPATLASGSGKGRGRRPRGLRPQAMSGDVVISKTEVLGTALKVLKDQTSVKGHFDLVPDTLPWLKGVFKAFERIQWRYVRVWWVTKVPATVGGSLAIGVDWDGTGDATTLPQIAAFSPNKECAVYHPSSECNLVLPSNRLRGRLWYTPLQGEWPDKSPAYIRYVVELSKKADADTEYGYLYIQYKVILSGTRPS